MTEAALETLRPCIESSFRGIVDDRKARVEAAVRAMQKQIELNELCYDDPADGGTPRRCDVGGARHETRDARLSPDRLD